MLPGLLRVAQLWRLGRRKGSLAGRAIALASADRHASTRDSASAGPASRQAQPRPASRPCALYLPVLGRCKLPALGARPGCRADCAHLRLGLRCVGTLLRRQTRRAARLLM